MNKKNRSDAYVATDLLEADIFICGSKDRNRALEGDLVAVEKQLLEPGEIAGGVGLGRLEALYSELFAEVIDDGVITGDEPGWTRTMRSRPSAAVSARYCSTVPSGNV